MFRKILLIICMAFFVLCYVYPCVMLPFGSYSGEIGSGDSKVERTMTFDTKGKVKIKTAEDEREYFYKMDGRTVIISEDETFDETDYSVRLNSIYEFAYENQMINNIGFYMAIGVGAFALILILLPNRRR